MQLDVLAIAIQGAAGVPVESILKMLSGALAMSLVVERVIEFSKNILDLVPTRAFGPTVYKEGEVDTEYNALVERLESVKRRSSAALIQNEIAVIEKRLLDEADLMKIAELRVERDQLSAKLDSTLGAIEEQEGGLVEGAPIDTLVVKPASDVDLAVTGRKFVLQMFAFAIGIFAAHLAGITLFNALLSPLARPMDPALDGILTGLFIGGGSGPVHTLIRFVTERKYTPTANPGGAEEAVETRTKVAVAQPASSVTGIEVGGGIGVAVAVRTDTTTWVDIAYTPIDVEILESVHRRRVKPRRIVYHHTAMHLNSPFDDVVTMIKRKREKGPRWLTGYHAVVTGDGCIHAFCRWDRTGNHALGHNYDSLGVTLNGNFETRSRDKYSNYNEKYGPSTPPDVQLRAAARVVALWCILYDIPLDFKNTIIPHKNVVDTVCPGSSFPYEEFQALVMNFQTSWLASPQAMLGIKLFARKPYLGAVNV